MLRFIVIDHLYFSPSITLNYRRNDLTSLEENSIIMSVDSPVGQMVKTPPSQGGVMSSILVRVISLGYSQIGKAQDSGSWMFEFEPQYPNKDE